MVQGRRHSTESEMLPTAGLPLLSTAGVKRERERMIRQVAASSAIDPLDSTTTHWFTRPFAAISSAKATIPSCRCASADGG